MKNILKIFIILSFSITFGQNKISLEYSQILAYRGNLDITIFTNYNKIKNDFIISLVGENITPNNTTENQIGIKTNKEKHLLFIELLKKYNTSNQIYYYNFDYDSEIFFYKTNTNRKVKNISNAILALQIDYLGICADTFFIYIFDYKKSILLLKELSNIYGNKKDFEKLIKIIYDNNP